MEVGKLPREERDILAGGCGWRGRCEEESMGRWCAGCKKSGVMRLASGLQAGGEACDQDGALPVVALGLLR